jgi:hypothetical protein
MKDLSQVLNREPSFAKRLYFRLEEAMRLETEVLFRFPWGSVSGVPIYLDPSCVEIRFLCVSEDEHDGPGDEISWKSIWLIRLEEVSAISYRRESWSKQGLAELLPKEEATSESEVKD